MTQESNVKRGPVYTRKVDRSLDHEAMEAKRVELQAIDNRLAAREMKAKEERKRISDELEAIKLEQQSCLAALNAGTVTEEVKVRDWMYLQTGNVTTKREDNGQTVDERPMTDNERQTEMFAKPEPAPEGGLSASIGEQAKAKKGKKAPKDRPN